MTIYNGYVQVRRGLLEHLSDGRLTPSEYLVFNILLAWADSRNGIATTHGPGIVSLSGFQLNLRTVQDALNSLDKKGYIKRPFYEQGSRAVQQIFIDKYIVTSGVLSDHQLILSKTTDWKNPFYEFRGEDRGESALRPRRSRAEAAPNNNKEEEKHDTESEIESEQEAAQPHVGQDTIPTSVQDEISQLCEILSSYSGNPVTPEWKKYAQLILTKHKLSALEKVLDWMFVESDFWGGVTHTMMNLYDHLEKGVVIKKYNALRALAKKKAAKAGSALTDGMTKRGDDIASRVESEI